MTDDVDMPCGCILTVTGVLTSLMAVIPIRCWYARHRYISCSGEPEHHMEWCTTVAVFTIGELALLRTSKPSGGLTVLLQALTAQRLLPTSTGSSHHSSQVTEVRLQIVGSAAPMLPSVRTPSRRDG